MLSFYNFLFKKYRYIIFGLFGFGLAVILFKRTDNRVFVGDNAKKVSSLVYKTGSPKDSRDEVCYQFTHYVTKCPKLHT